MESNEFKSANLFFERISNAPLDHHGRAVVECLPKAIEAGLPAVPDYLDARFIQTEQVKQIRRGALDFRHGLDYVYTTGSLWDSTQQVEDRLFQVSPVDADIKLEYLDLPRLHCYGDKAGDEFFSALADTEDIELFNSRSIQTIIDYKWPLVRQFTIYRLFLPFIAF